MTKLAYYPGCSLHSTAKELDSSFDGTMAKLDVDLAEIPGWQCCGNSAGHSANRLLAAALPANELAKVKDDMKLDAVAVPCAACYNRFQSANHEVGDEAMAADIAAGRRAPLRRRRQGSQPGRRLPRPGRPGGAQGQGREALPGSQGRLLLRLPAHATAEGHAGRRPRVPRAHGRRRWRPSAAHRSSGTRRPTAAAPAWRSASRMSSTSSSRRSSPTPASAALRRSPAPARSARSTWTAVKVRSRRRTARGSTCRSSTSRRWSAARSA